MGEEVVIRRAEPADGPTVLRMVCALAEYEELPAPDAGAQQRLLTDLFRDPPPLQAFLAELDGEPAGCALVFRTYSTFRGLPNLYVEDLVVLPEFRGRGVGTELFRFCADEARRQGCGRLEWAVLDWNEPALRFYERHGGRPVPEWRLYRLDLQE